MATGTEHYLEAERLLRVVDSFSPRVAAGDGPHLLQAAQVHATLALTAATALNAVDAPESDYEAWHRAASADGADHISPTDPAGLGAWLRGLPARTVLRDQHGTAWQLGLGYLTTFDGGEPETHDFPALLCVGSDSTFSTATADEFDLDTLAQSAPFTVLHLGDEPEGGAS